MKRPRVIFARLAALAAAVAVFFPQLGLSLEIVDDLGRPVALERPAQRVIPLYGAFAEMLFTLGAGSQVVARTQADQFPKDILNLPAVGTHMRPNVEMILGMKPDLVILSATRGETSLEAGRLRDAGIPVAVFAPSNFQQIFSVMRRLGDLTGHGDEATKAIGSMEKRLADVKGLLAEAKERPRVFFEVRAEPLTGAGRGSIVEQILAAAGAENVVKSEKAIVRYSFEALLLDNPEVYIVQQGPMNRNPSAPAQRPHFHRLRAVQNGRVISVDELLYSRPGPRCVDAVEQLASALYPHLFKTTGQVKAHSSSP